MVILPRLKSPVLSVFSAAGLRIIKSKAPLLEREKKGAAIDVVSSLSFVPYYRLMTNVSNQTVHMPKNMVITYGASIVPQLVKHCKPCKITSGIPKTNAVYKPTEREQMKIRLREQVKEEGEERLDLEWQSKDKIDDVYYENKIELMEAFYDLQSMLDHHLRRTSIAKDGLKLFFADFEDIYSTPHRTGLNRREVKKREIYDMISRRDFYPTHTKWVAPIVLASKMNQSRRFYVVQN